MGRLTTVPTKLPSLTVGLLTRSIDHHEKEFSRARHRPRCTPERDHLIGLLPLSA
jgi:hypothetical protein